MQFHMPRYSMSALLLVVALAVVHVNQYVFPHSILIRHIVLIAYLAYAAWQYKKHMYWNYTKVDRRQAVRDTRVPAEVYGRLRAEEAIAGCTHSLEELIKYTPSNSQEFLAGYKARIEEEIIKRAAGV